MKIKWPTTLHFFQLSASTFEAGGLATPILATTSDGQLSFLRTTSTSSAPTPSSPVTTWPASGISSPSAAITSEEVSADREGTSLDRDQVREVGSGTSLGERKNLMLRLMPEILSTTDVPSFAKCLLKSAKLIVGGSERADLLVLNSPNTFEGLTYVLLSVEGDDGKTTTGVMNRMRLNTNSNYLVSSALTAAEVLNANSDKYELVLQPDNFKVSNGLVSPLIKPSQGGGTLGCLQLYNKRGGGSFTTEDVVLFKELTEIASKCLVNVLAQQEMRLELSRSEVFLELARTVFREPSHLEPTMLTILTNFLSLIDCERCQILLSDPNMPTVFKRVFDLDRRDLNESEEGSVEKLSEGRIPINSTIAMDVARTGQKVNIGSPFCSLPEKDDEEEVQVNEDKCPNNFKSFLCSPIRDPDNRVLGVISLINKDESSSTTTTRAGDSGPSSSMFTSNDERFVEAFAIFCGMAIRNAADYEKAVVSEAKLQVAFEVMHYQATSSADEALQLANMAVPSAATFHIDSLQFSYLGLDDNGTLLVRIRLYHYNFNPL